MTVGAATASHVRDLLAGSPFDWLVLADPSNVAYATGYRSVGADLFAGYRSLAVIGPPGAFMVGPASDAGPATETAVDPDRYEPYGTFFFESETSPVARMAGRHADPAAALATLAARIGMSGVIGLDAAAAGSADLPGGAGEVADATEWLAVMRRIKLPVEVEVLRAAARLAEDAIDAALAAAAVGVTERELAGVVAETMVAGGGHPRFLVVTSGPRTALADARATHRQLAAGDLVRFDVGCVVEGYWSDIGRTAVVGEPDAVSVRRYGAILAGEQAQLEHARPGTTAAALFQTAVDVVEEAGLTPYRRHHCGHGIGLDVYERPFVAPGDPTMLEPGMVLCVETPFYDLDRGGMMVEDALVITEDGCEVLTTSDRSLREIPA